MPVALKSGIVAVERSRRKHEACEGELVRRLPVLGNFEVVIFDAGELMEGALEGAQGGGARHEDRDTPSCRRQIHQRAALI